MSPQTLLKPVTGKKPTQAPTQSRGRHRAPAASAQRNTTPRHAVRHPVRNGSRLWTTAGFAVLFVLSLLAGVLLAVHGPSQQPSSVGSGRGSSVILEPGTPATPWVTEPPSEAAEPKTPDSTATPRGPQKKKPKPTVSESSTITLKPGDTLYALARTHDTLVRNLQRLNGLGSSTLIYAGHDLRIPTAAGPSTVSGVSTTVPAPATKPAKKAAKPAESSGKSTGRPAPGAVVAFARAQLGKPYVWGGTGPRGFDCSGLVMRAWEKAGVKLPRTTWGQIKAGRATTRSALVPGDLVITSGGGHVQLYMGNGRVIHAPRPGRTVTVAPLYESGVLSYRHITA